MIFILKLFISGNIFSNSYLYFVGILFIIFEKLFFSKRQQEKSITEISKADAILIGFAQSLAIIPGVSRSGIVLLFMLFRGYKRYESAEYTFMLGIPILFLASGFDLVQVIQSKVEISALFLLLFRF